VDEVRVTVPRLVVVSDREPYEHRLGGTWVSGRSGEENRQAVGPDGIVGVPPDSPAYQLKRVWPAPRTSDTAIRDTRTRSSGRCATSRWIEWPTGNRSGNPTGHSTSISRIPVNEELRKGPSAVWVHDFRLALLPRPVKRANPDKTVALFWPVPGRAPTRSAFCRNGSRCWTECSSPTVWCFNPRTTPDVRRVRPPFSERAGRSVRLVGRDDCS